MLKEPTGIWITLKLSGYCHYSEINCCFCSVMFSQNNSNTFTCLKEEPLQLCTNINFVIKIQKNFCTQDAIQMN